MNALITIDALPPGALTTAEIDATMAYAEAEKALATRQAYASDWRTTSPPGAPSRGATGLPAHQGIVVPTSPASPTAAARPAPSGVGPPRSAATTRWPATSHRPAARL